MRRRDCLHQTPIEAQPPQSSGADRWVRGSRNDSVPSYRPIHGVDSWVRRPWSVVAGLGGGAEQSSSILRDPDLKTERERASNHSARLPGPSAMDLECARRRMGLPEGEILAGSAHVARVRRWAHSLPSLLGASPRMRVRPHLERAERLERNAFDRRFRSAFGRTHIARSARLLLRRPAKPSRIAEAQRAYRAPTRWRHRLK